MEHTHTIFGGNKELNIINYCRNINQETQDKKKNTTHPKSDQNEKRNPKYIISQAKNSSTHNRQQNVYFILLYF